MHIEVKQVFGCEVLMVLKVVDHVLQAVRRQELKLAVLGTWTPLEVEEGCRLFLRQFTPPLSSLKNSPH